MEPLDNVAKASRRHFGMSRDSAGCAGVFGQEQTSGLYTDRVSLLAESRLDLSRIAYCTQDTLGAFQLYYF